MSKVLGRSVGPTVPVVVARASRCSHLPVRSVVIDPFAVDGRAANIAKNPFAPMLYHASAMISMPNSLSQDVGFGLGTQAGHQQLSDVMAEAGDSSLERCAETPFNLILQAKPQCQPRMQNLS